MVRLLSILALLCAFVPAAARAQTERSDSRVYIFGNSLVNHLSDEADFTNVPHWINQMAKADGRSFAVDGQWGFLRNFADSGPTANWSFPGVSGAWSPGQGGFRDGRFDAVIVTPGNFIQYQLPDVPYDGDNPAKESPLGAMQRLLDWIQANSPESRLFVYEGWAAMDEIVESFPPTPRETAAYHAHNAGEYHQWYQDLLNVLEVTRPDTKVTLIPVASILAPIFAKGGLLEDLPPEALYTDNAPHGTPTLYLLAAMVTYAWLYDAPPPQDFAPPATLHPDVVEAYRAIADAIWAARPKPQVRSTPAATTPEPVVAPASALPRREDIVLPPRGVVPDGAPSLGLGLNGLSDWSTQHPFLDLMKSSRGWVGNIGDTWGAVSTEELRAGGHLDGNDWPLRLPDGVDALETVILTDQHPDAASLRGDYVLTYDGKASIRLVGRAKRVRRDAGRITFTYAPGEGLVALSITEIDPADPIRNIVILRKDHVALYAAGALFNPDWLARIEDVRSVRFMDWMLTNGSPVATWDQRPTMAQASWTQWGVPVEVMVRLANVIGADPWFNMPHRADDAYVRQFAELVRRDLDPRLRVYVEYSNEVWNQIFPQAAWAREQAEALWGPSDMGGMQFYGLRAAQVMDLWTEVYGDASDRLVRVVATHTGWPGLEEQILKAPLAFLQLGRMPVGSFDAYAVTGYFGYEMGGQEMARRMDGWLDASEEMARAAGEAEGLRRVALREYVKDARFEGAIAPVAKALELGSLRQLVKEVFPYHGGVARKNGLRLVMYEGGTHLVGHGNRVNDERLTDFLVAFSYTPEMAKLYEQLLAGWVAAGGTLFNAFVDVAPATKWGSWGALRFLEDQNPRWDMLMAYNASGPNAWEVREEAAFLNGIRVLSGSGRIEGTAQEDYLTGGPGDEVIFARGGADVIHGGPGQDRVVLAGSAGDYDFVEEGGVILARYTGGAVRLTAIEDIAFAAAPGTVRPIADLLK